MPDFVVQKCKGPFWMPDRYELELSICLQMETGLYVEPVKGVPSTYEDEKRHYTLDELQLQEVIDKARFQISLYMASVQNSIALERLGATYGDVHRIMAHEEPTGFPGQSDNPFEADEDLAFLYNRLSELHLFLFELAGLRDS